jgi:hypothetical protein
LAITILELALYRYACSFQTRHVQMGFSCG